MLKRTIVLIGSSESLNTGSCSFHLVAARETRVVGWCKCWTIERGGESVVTMLKQLCLF